MISTFSPWPTLMVMYIVGSQTECGEKTDDLSAHLRRDLHPDNLEDLDQVAGLVEPSLDFQGFQDFPAHINQTDKEQGAVMVLIPIETSPQSSARTLLAHVQIVTKEIHPSLKLSPRRLKLALT